MPPILTERGLRLMVWGAISLGIGIFLLLAVSLGWLGRLDGTASRIALAGAIVANFSGAVFFLRYLLGVLRDWNKGDR